MKRAAALMLVLLLAGCAASRALHEEDFLRVTNGMSQDEVRGVIGSPGRTEAFARQRQVAWDYSFTDAWGFFAFVSVIFDADGRVVGKTHTRIEPQDG